MDASTWDARYAAAELVWSAGPNATVAELTAPLTPGRAVDLAAGEGRNALWLAERGWDATAVDYSSVAMDRARRIAAERLGEHADRFTAVTADVLGWAAIGTAYDLVLVIFLHLPAADLRRVHRAAAAAVAPGGRLLVLAHDRSNLHHGHGGPQEAAILPTPDEIVADLDGSGLLVERAEVILREVADAPRPARDALVWARRPA